MNAAMCMSTYEHNRSEGQAGGLAGMDQVGVRRRLRDASTSIQLRNIIAALFCGAAAWSAWNQGTMFLRIVSFFAAAVTLAILRRFA